MLKNPKAKGSRREREVRDIFIAKGYDVVKAAGSLGMFDLVAIYKNVLDMGGTYENVCLIQVKSNRITPDEVQVIADHSTVARKEIWIKKDRKPWMMTVIEDGPEGCEMGELVLGSKRSGPC